MRQAIPEKIEYTGIMASKFETVFSSGRQSIVNLPAEIKRENEPKGATPETGIFTLLGHTYLNQSYFYLLQSADCYSRKM